MDDFERPEAPKLDGEDVLQPDDVTPTEEVLSRIEQETPVVAPQILTPEQLLAQKKSKKKVLLIVLAVVLAFAAVSGVVWFVLANNATQSDAYENTVGEIIGGGDGKSKEPTDELAPKDEIVELSVDDELVQRLFSEFDFIADFWTNQPSFYVQAVNGGLERQMIMNSAFLSLDTTECRGNYEFEMNDGSWWTATNCYSGEAIRQKIMKLFGLKYTFTSNDLFRVLAVPYAYSELNDEFYPTDTGFGWWPTSGIIRELYKAEKSKSRIYLYEMATYWSEESSSCDTKAVCRLGYGGWNVKTDGLMPETIKQLEKLSEYPGANEIFDKFKWTFVWNGENYVFEKLEKIQ